ncbi:MAG: hypothetical protein AB7Q17_04170 [Phycisphaerae bacterium]
MFAELGPALLGIAGGVVTVMIFGAVAYWLAVESAASHSTPGPSDHHGVSDARRRAENHD